jgi:hypothetical protein
MEMKFHFPMVAKVKNEKKESETDGVHGEGGGGG